MKVSPNVVVVRLNGEGDVFTARLKAADIKFDIYDPDKKDYYSLPTLVTLLARKSTLDLVYEVMDTPLLTRKPFEG
jgi:hypothetical protein